MKGTERKISSAQRKDFFDMARAGLTGDVAVFLAKYPDAATAATEFTGETALMIAAGNGYLDLVELLLDKGVAVNRTDRDGWTALMRAACKGHRLIVEALLESGADVNCRSLMAKKTAYDYAWQRGETFIANLLRDWPTAAQKEKMRARELESFSPALKRAIPAPRPLHVKRVTP